MSTKLKPVAEQIIVITGASSGIGLATARMAAKRGARLVLAARSKRALDDLAREITEAGGQAIAVPTDVATSRTVLPMRLSTGWRGDRGWGHRSPSRRRPST